MTEPHLSPQQETRRDFLKQAGGIGFLVLFAGAGVGLSPYLKADTSLLLRPPGAVEEDDFLALCVKCGQCLQVCPYDSILLADIDTGHGVGTPYIDARERGCYLCPLLPCVLACPSGALDHHVEDVKNVEMGVAFVHDIKSCIAMENKRVSKAMIDRLFTHAHTLSSDEQQSRHLGEGEKSNKRELEEAELQKALKLEGEPCTLCADLCPLPNKEQAIRMVAAKNGGKMPQILDACVGCGVCVEVCPTRVLEIQPRKTYDQIYS